MPFYKGIPANATIAYMTPAGPQYKVDGESIYEFGEYTTINGEWAKEHTNLLFTYGSQISIYKGLTSVPVFSSKPKEEIKVIPEELIACLKRIKDKLLKKPNIHIGWYAKNTSLEFIYKDKIYKINPWTLDFDEIDFGEATDWKKDRYNGGLVGNADAYFEQSERIIRATLNEELGIVFFHGHGDID